MAEVLSQDEVLAALDGLDDWTGDIVALRRTVVLATFRQAIEVVRRVAEQAEEVDHHPDIDIRWRTLVFALSTHAANGVTARDLDLAARIDAVISDV